MDAGIKELFKRYENLVQDYRQMYEKQRNLAEERYLKITQLEAENFAISLKIRNLDEKLAHLDKLAKVANEFDQILNKQAFTVKDLEKET